MIKKTILFLSFAILCFSCNGNFVSSNDTQLYIKSKSEFNSRLTEHFPKTLTTYPYTIINNKNLSKNTVGFMLCEFEKDSVKIDSVIRSIQKKIIGKYNFKDPCLLIVNRFETAETFEERKDVVITDSTKINQDCYKKLFPIPNFLEFNSDEYTSNSKFDESFDIYVLEAKAGNYFKEFDLLTDLQMPKEWENGYSKGIAISKKKKMIIYWGIIW